MSVRDKLRDEIGPVKLRDLAPHHVRGALFVVSPPLELLDVAVAVAEDEADAVRGWLESGALRRSTDDDMAAWPEEGFDAAIVQPYVLVAPPEDG